MRFEYQRVEPLPRLAWCARESEILCVASTNGFEWLYAVRAGDELLLSNSLAFALVESDDAPALSHPHYYADFLAIFRAGTSRPERAWLPTQRGRRVFLYARVTLRIRSDLSTSRSPRPEPPVPGGYAEYVRALEDALARVQGNAEDAKRLQSYRPLATRSRGYDSPAVAVVAARTGVREAVTFTDVKGTGGADSGAVIAERLGLRVTEYPHLGLARSRVLGSAPVSGAIGFDGWSKASAACRGRHPPR